GRSDIGPVYLIGLTRRIDTLIPQPVSSLDGHASTRGRHFGSATFEPHARRADGFPAGLDLASRRPAPQLTHQLLNTRPERLAEQGTGEILQAAFAEDN